MCIISYRGDLARYSQLRMAIDNIVGECAEFTAVNCEDGDEQLAIDFAVELLKHTMNGFHGIYVKNYTCEVSRYGGYAEAQINMDIKGLFSFLCPSGVSLASADRRKIMETEEGIEEEIEENGEES